MFFVHFIIIASDVFPIILSPKRREKVVHYELERSDLDPLFEFKYFMYAVNEKNYEVVFEYSIA